MRDKTRKCIEQATLQGPGRRLGHTSFIRWEVDVRRGVFFPIRYRVGEPAHVQLVKDKAREAAGPPVSKLGEMG